MNEEKFDLGKLAREQKRNSRKAKRNAKEKEKENKKMKLIAKIFLWLFLIITFVGMVINTILDINLWSQKHIIKTQSPITFNKPIWAEDVQPLKVISPLVEVKPIEEVSNPIEKEILRLFGERYFLVVRSIFKCESGLREDAVNWKTQDVGIAQINFPTWEKPIKEKFGYTLKDMFDYKKNLEVAKWIADRDGDGKDLDFGAWVVFNNGTFANCVQ